MKKKIVAFVLVFALALALGIGGTLAWLTAESGTVTNTFTIGDINITLAETDESVGIDTNTEDSNNEYHFVPGATLPKDPKVTVTAKSEACWLFVKVTETNNNITGLDGDIIEWSVDTSEGWQPVSGAENVWYVNVSAADAKAGKDYDVLTEDQVTVNSDVTKKMADDVIEKNKPQLSFKAYAIQSENLKSGTADVNTPEQAWALLNP